MRRPLLTATAIVGTMTLIPLATSAMAQVDTSTYREFDQFLDVFNRIKADYVDKVDDKTLIKGAINGMLSSLDPHSSYVDAVDYDNLKIMTDGNYGGLGLTVSMEDGAVKVIAPQEDTPAARAGVKAGDYITHIDGKLIFGDTLDEAITQMRGKPGTKITLGLVRPGRDKPLDVTMTREVITQKPVKWDVRGDVGYININTFSENTGADTRAAIQGIDKSLGHHPLGYVVDLRDNGGGLLTQAIEVSDAFLDHGEIVSQRGREKNDIERYYAKPGDDAHGLPVIVLTDAGTASASEIVAGALQDQHRAIIMGERSFGKGSVQTLLQLGPQTALRLTTARYYTPSGRSVQEGGIAPDIAVPQLSDPDYKTRPTFREADLRRHLINDLKIDNKALEEDDKTDPRFAESADALKKQGIDDFQLYYALKTIARLGGPTQIAAATKPPRQVTPGQSLGRLLALAIPAVLLLGALGSQYIGGLYPCEMCHWQRWPHYAAVVVAGLAFIVPGRGTRNALVSAAALLIAVSGAIGVAHAGVEYGWWPGFTACTSTVSMAGATTPAERLAAIMQAPMIRCDVAQWRLFGISLAGFNAIISLCGAIIILMLMRKRVR